MLKKILSYTVNTVSVLIIAAALFVLLSVVMTRSGETPNVLGYSAFRVVSGSMAPTISENDLILVRKTPAAEIAVGDVISFYSADPILGGAVNTHRVTAIAHGDAGIVFTTKGDASLTEDRYPVREEMLLGKMVFASHALGIAARLAANPIIFIPLILLPLLLILAANMIRTVRLAKEAVREEEEAALHQALEELRRAKAEQTEGAENAPEQESEGEHGSV